MPGGFFVNTNLKNNKLFCRRKPGFMIFSQPFYDILTKENEWALSAENGLF